MIQPIKAALPSLREIKNVDYTQAKTKANKFAEKIIEHAQVKNTNDNTVALRQNDKYSNSDNANIENDENDQYLSSDVDASNLNFPTPKTTAHKFVQQIKEKEEYNPQDFKQIGFVEIENNKKTTGGLPLPKINVRDIKEISLKNEVIKNISQLPLKQSFIANILSGIDTYLKANPIKVTDNPKQVTQDYLGKIIDETIQQLIENADLAESMLNLEIAPEVNDLQLAFFEKLKSIIVDLDKALKANYKHVDDLKKDSKVEIKIKRFDVRDIKTSQNRSISF